MHSSGAIKFDSARSSFGGLESCRNYKDFSIIFTKILDAI